MTSLPTRCGSYPSVGPVCVMSAWKPFITYRKKMRKMYREEKRNEDGLLCMEAERTQHTATEENIHIKKRFS